MRILTMMSNSIFSPQDSFLSLPPLSTLSQFQDCIPRCLSMLREAKNYWEKKFNRIQTSSRKAEKKTFTFSAQLGIPETTLCCSDGHLSWKVDFILCLIKISKENHLRRRQKCGHAQTGQLPWKSWFYPLFDQSLKKIIWDRDRNVGTPKQDSSPEKVDFILKV